MSTLAVTLPAAAMGLDDEAAIGSRRVSLYEAKTHLSALIDAVEAGESITITRHGRPVARLVAPEDELRRRARDAVARWRAYAASHPPVYDDDPEFDIRDRRTYGHRR